MRQAMRSGDSNMAGVMGTKMGVKHIVLAKKLLGGNLDEKKAEKVYDELKKERKAVEKKHYLHSEDKAGAIGRIEAKLYSLADMVGDYDMIDKYQRGE